MKLTGRLLLFLFLPLAGMAQNNTHAFFFDQAPQTQYLNPGRKTPYRMMAALPFVSDFYFSFHNPAFPLTAIFNDNILQDNLDEIITNLGESERLNLSYRTEMFNFGFRVRETGFLSFGMSTHFDLNFQLSGPVLRYVRFSDYPDVGSMESIDKLSAEFLTYNRYYVGYQFDLNENVTLGASLGAITGGSNFYFRQNNVSIYRQNGQQRIRTDFLVNTSFKRDENGKAQFGIRDMTMPISYAQNVGLGLDLGATIRTSEKMEVSVSFLNIGFISWGNNPITFRSNSDFRWNDGLDYNQYNFTNFIDSLVSDLNFERVSEQRYATPLPLRVMMGARYKVTEKHHVAGALELFRFHRSMYANVGLTYFGTLYPWLQVMSGVSLVGNDFFNIPLGINLNLGPVQVFAMSDHIFQSFQLAQIIGTATSSSFRVGVSMALK